MSICLGLFYSKKLGHCVHLTLILNFLCSCFLRVFFAHGYNIQVKIMLTLVREESFIQSLLNSPHLSTSTIDAQKPVTNITILCRDTHLFDITPFIMSLSSSMFLTFLLYTRSFIILQNQKSQGVKSGECSGHANCLPQSIQRFRKIWSRQAQTVREK